MRGQVVPGLLGRPGAGDFVSLYLIGLRGSGKSAAGARAAASLGIPFVDSDEQVEQRAGMDTAAIILGRGWEAFRELEREVMVELLRLQGTLVATGGGCVLDPELRRGLERQQGVVWLTEASPRPPLTEAPAAEEPGLLLRQREHHYLACADRTVDTEQRTVEEVAGALQQLWTVLPHHHLR